MVQTLSELQKLLHDAIVTITSLNPKNVRPAFQQRNQPGRTIDQDIVYLKLEQVDDEWDKLQSIEYDPDYDREESFYTRVMQATFYCYGPNSFEIVDHIRFGMYQPAVRLPLNIENVKPIVQPPAPVRASYMFDSQWWERSDLKMFFNVGTLRASTVPWLQGARVELYDEEGLQRVANISE